MSSEVAAWFSFFSRNQGHISYRANVSTNRQGWQTGNNGWLWLNEEKSGTDFILISTAEIHSFIQAGLKNRKWQKTVNCWILKRIMCFFLSDDSAYKWHCWCWWRWWERQSLFASRLVMVKSVLTLHLIMWRKQGQSSEKNNSCTHIFNKAFWRVLSNKPSNAFISPSEPVAIIIQLHVFNAVPLRFLNSPQLQTMIIVNSQWTNKVRPINLTPMRRSFLQHMHVIQRKKHAWWRCSRYCCSPQCLEVRLFFSQWSVSYWEQARVRNVNITE